MMQYKIVRIKDGKVLGYIIGKTTIDGKPYLVYQLGVKTGKIQITDATQRFYRVDAEQIG